MKRMQEDEKDIIKSVMGKKYLKNRLKSYLGNLQQDENF